MGTKKFKDPEVHRDLPEEMPGTRADALIYPEKSGLTLEASRSRGIRLRITNHPQAVSSFSKTLSTGLLTCGFGITAHFMGAPTWVALVAAIVGLIAAMSIIWFDLNIYDTRRRRGL